MRTSISRTSQLSNTEFWSGAESAFIETVTQAPVCRLTLAL